MTRFFPVVLLAACTAPPPHELPDAAACVVPMGAGTMHGSAITAAETWTADASPHVIPNDIAVRAVVTVEPCAVVQLASGVVVTVAPAGAIDATSATIDEPGATLRVIGGQLSLVDTVVKRGGGEAAIVLRGTDSVLHAERLEVADAVTTGIFVDGAPGFDDTSTDVRIHGAGGFPIHTWGRRVGQVPAGDYTGNHVDAIQITGGGVTDAITTSQTLHDRGVPYHVGIGDGVTGRLDVSGGATLTIEPGVVMAFEHGGALEIDPTLGTNPANGTLIAVGTAAKPIVFTSTADAPAAGDWRGVWLGQMVQPATRIDHVRVEYAGGTSVSQSSSCPYTSQSGPNDAGIRIMGSALPPDAFVTNSEIFASAGHGIDRGWRSDVKTTFLSTNTFTNIARCKETFPRDASGGCPASPPCP